MAGHLRGKSLLRPEGLQRVCAANESVLDPSFMTPALRSILNPVPNLPK